MVFLKHKSDDEVGKDEEVDGMDMQKPKFVKLFTKQFYPLMA